MESDKISKQHKSNTKDCECFMCRNKNNPEILYGYLKGQIEAYEDVVRFLDKLKIPTGLIHENNLPGLKACCECNLEDNKQILDELLGKVIKYENINK